MVCSQPAARSYVGVFFPLMRLPHKVHRYLPVNPEGLSGIHRNAEVGDLNSVSGCSDEAKATSLPPV